MIWKNNSFQRIGYNRRMQKIFKKDGNTLAIGLDHGTSMGLVKGLDNLGKTTRFFLDIKSDAILLGPKSTTWENNEIDKNISSSLWLRLNRTNVFDEITPNPWSTSNIAEVEDAIKLDADAVVVWYIRDISGNNVVCNNEENIAKIAKKCRCYGIPLVVEALTLGDSNNSELINTSRIAYELGADILKINFPNSIDNLKDIVNSVDIPVLLAGGPEVKDTDEFYKMMEKAMDVGIKGLVIGRNIWQAEDPKKVFNKLSKIVHK